MNIETARTRAASAWCSPENSHKQMDVEMAEAFTNVLITETASLERELERAWGIIANAGGGNWANETPQWQKAAAEWRDRYHALVVPDDQAQRLAAGIERKKDVR